MLTRFSLYSYHPRGALHGRDLQGARPAHCHRRNLGGHFARPLGCVSERLKFPSFLLLPCLNSFLSGLGQPYPCPTGGTAKTSLYPLGAPCDSRNPTLVLFPTAGGGLNNIRNYLAICAQLGIVVFSACGNTTLVACLTRAAQCLWWGSRLTWRVLCLAFVCFLTWLRPFFRTCCARAARKRPSSPCFRSRRPSSSPRASQGISFFSLALTYILSSFVLGPWLYERHSTANGAPVSKIAFQLCVGTSSAFRCPF